MLDEALPHGEIQSNEISTIRYSMLKNGGINAYVKLDR